MSMARQNEDLDKWRQDQALYGGVIHAMKKRPFLMRVPPPSPEKATTGASAKASAEQKKSPA